MSNERGSDLLASEPAQACMHVGMCPLTDVDDADTLVSARDGDDDTAATRDPVLSAEIATASREAEAAEEEEEKSKLKAKSVDPEDDESETVPGNDNEVRHFLTFIFNDSIIFRQRNIKNF